MLLGDWHVVFIFLTFMGAAVLAMALWLMPETLAIGKRSQLSFKATFASWGGIIRDRRFIALAVTGGLLFGQVCVFIAGAPFALEGGFHLTPTQYTFAFAAVTVVMFSANSLNRYLLKKIASINLLRYGLSQAVFAAIFMTTLNLLNVHTLALPVVVSALPISAIGFRMAPMTGLAMRDHGERAGTAAGLLGFSNSIGGAIAAPLTSLIFGLDIVGVTLFMSILLVTAAVIGLIGTRREKAVIH